MWLTLYVLVLIFAWYQSFFWSPFHLYVLFSVLYVLVYVLRAEGREWHWFRSWSLWDRFRKWYFPHHVHSLYWNEMATALDSDEDNVLVFLIVNPVSLVDTVSAFGLHGQKNPVLQRISPLIMAPWYLFYLPYVTDLIQWAGLVSERRRSEDYTDAVNNLVTSWRCNVVVPCEEAVDDDYREVKWAAEHARAGKSLCIVPVLHGAGSSRLYRSCTLCSTRRQYQSWMWPFFGFGYLGTCLPRRVELHTFVGRPIRVVGDTPVLVDLFIQELKGLTMAANANRGDWDIEQGH